MITSDARNTDVSNAEAAATPPSQLPTQHASNFQVPVFFFFFFKFVRAVWGGPLFTRGFSQIWLQVREESKKSFRIMLRLGDVVVPIVNIWRFKKYIYFLLMAHVFNLIFYVFFGYCYTYFIKL
jgi:hypothetical protein